MASPVCWRTSARRLMKSINSIAESGINWARAQAAAKTNEEKWPQKGTKNTKKSKSAFLFFVPFCGYRYGVDGRSDRDLGQRSRQYGQSAQRRVAALSA